MNKLLQEASKQLAAVTDTPALEAEILLAHALNMSRTGLYARSSQPMAEDAAVRFAAYLQRRCQQEPIAYITGRREFWTLDLMVTQDTLIPRPETELLLDRLLAEFPQRDEKRRVADLGTGSGAVALALAAERPRWEIYATDICERALAVAKLNGERCLGDHSVQFVQGDWCHALPSGLLFDAIVSNPPYLAESEWQDHAAGLAYEPVRALTSGKEGLDAIRSISQGAKSHLLSAGVLMLEHGYAQAEAVSELLVAEGYQSVVSFRDLSGHLRVTEGRWINQHLLV